MKGFIQVTIERKVVVAGVKVQVSNADVYETLYTKRYLAVNRIFDFEDGRITTTKRLHCEHTRTYYNEVLTVSETARDIKMLIEIST